MFILSLKQYNSIKDLVLENIKVDKRSYKDVITYYIGYKTVDVIKDFYINFKETIAFVGEDDDNEGIENNDVCKFLSRDLLVKKTET